MKLATLNDGTRDGALLVVRRDLQRWASASDIAPTLQAALDAWDQVAQSLHERADALERGAIAGEPFALELLRAPLPRAYEWIDGSAYINHIVLVRKARKAEPPATLRTDPLVYQGGSGVLLDPTADLVLADPDHGLDFEAEICAILGDVPLGTPSERAADHIRLFVLCNDVTLRNLIPGELAKGFGFFQSKPATAFSPVAVTPDELGDALKDGRVHLTLTTTLNGEPAGAVPAGPEMHFSFHDLLAHVTRTRALTAGTILGSGTVSSESESAGVSCLAERRMREIIATGTASTRFLEPGDVVQITMADARGRDLFGPIRQSVVKGW